MCIVSFVGDHYRDKWSDRYPVWPAQAPYQIQPITISDNTELDKLREEVREMKELLRKAKIYDEKNNEPNCEIEDKMNFLRGVAKLVGIDLDDVLKSNTIEKTI